MATDACVKRIPFFYGWLVLGMCVFVKLFKVFGQNSMMVFSIPAIMEDLQISRSKLSVLFTIGTMSSAACQPLMGMMVDSLGARICIPLGLCVLGSALVLFGTITRHWQLLLAFFALRGCAMGALELWPNTCLGQWFVRLRGLAMAVQLSAYNILQGFIAIAYNHSVHTHGWRKTQWIAALAPFALILPVIIIVRKNPESCGTTPDPPLKPKSPPSSTSTEKDNGTGPNETEMHVKPTTEGELETQAPPSPAASMDEPSTTLKQAVKGPMLWTVALLGFSLFCIGAGSDFHLMGMISEIGGTYNLASFVYLPLGWTVAFSSVTSGLLIDRHKLTPSHGLALCSCIAALCAFGATVCSTWWSGITYGCFRGCSIGLYYTSYPVFVARVYGRKYLGSVAGFVQMFTTWGAGIGPIVFAFAKDYQGTFRWALYAFCVPSLICAVFVVVFAPAKPVAVGNAGGRARHPAASKREAYSQLEEEEAP
eukprot:TRINITY_DN53751_c0_g1_i1.p1 TRINITY_DN53751_c0_g1~~TRINITY_DN53751_c0_g1_i1.p1  ORF type:complete len:481 (+),score=28.39 TRINITY_DN53751_c0_g1_i1:77-1519(+)